MARKEAIAKEYKYKDVDVWNKRGKLKEGDAIDGYYIAKEEFTSKKFGDGCTFIIKSKDGTLYKLMGQSDVKAKMLSLPLGCYVWVMYSGIVETPNGSRKTYKIDYDDEDVIEVEESEE